MSLPSGELCRVADRTLAQSHLGVKSFRIEISSNQLHCQVGCPGDEWIFIVTSKRSDNKPMPEKYSLAMLRRGKCFVKKTPPKKKLLRKKYIKQPKALQMQLKTKGVPQRVKCYDASVEQHTPVRRACFTEEPHYSPLWMLCPFAGSLGEVIKHAQQGG